MKIYVNDIVYEGDFTKDKMLDREELVFESGDMQSNNDDSFKEAVCKAINAFTLDSIAPSKRAQAAAVLKDIFKVGK